MNLVKLLFKFQPFGTFSIFRYSRNSHLFIPSLVESIRLQHWQFPQFERGRRSEPRLCCLSPPSYWKNGNGQVPPNPPNPKPQILLSAMGVRSPPAPGDVTTCLQFLSTVSALIT